MRYLRYYAPYINPDEHRKILQLLEEIKRRHGIEYEEVVVEKTDWYKEPKIGEIEVYEKHLKPQTRVIKENTGMTASKIFKSKKSGYIHVAGTVCVVEDGYVIYATPWKPVEFLEEVLRDPEIIHRFKSRKDKRIKDTHSYLFEKLIEKNLPEPEIPKENKIWVKEVVTGFKRVGLDPKAVKDLALSLMEELKEYEYARKALSERFERTRRTGSIIIDQQLYRKFLQEKLSDRYGFGRPLYVFFVDFLVITPNQAWILEGKDKLNFEAIGQILVYRDLIEEDYPELGNVRMGIVCKRGDERLEKTCGKLGIEVFNLNSIRSTFLSLIIKGRKPLNEGLEGINPPSPEEGRGYPERV